MSEGVNETAVSFVDSSTATPTTTAATTTTTTTDGTTVKTTLECDEAIETQPVSRPSSKPHIPSTKTSKKTTYVVRKYRKYTSNGRAFHLIDGKKIRSALTHKKWPPRDRRVSFPSDDNQLVTGYLEPANPWEEAKNVNTEDLISSYKASCQRHGAEPMDNLIAQLEKLDISDDERCPELSLKNECLDAPHCEPLEELLKRVQFEKIDVESSSLDDESATILFDMLEYYQSARHLNMSSNRNIGARGWQACAQMIKKTTCLEQLEARDITLTQQHMNILKRPLQLVSHLHVLKLENCGLAGRAFVILVAALKMNTGIKELYLADNGFEQEDAIQLGALLRVNNHLQLLDISNNHIKDEGVRDLMDGLVAQSGECTNGKGLSILVLWNNDLTRSSSPYFSDAIAQSRTLETLNIGKNTVGNELFELAQEPLIKTRSLLQLGMQSTNVTCKGALLLAGIIEKNRSLQRIDLRDNNIQMEGLAALSFAMKRNPCVTQLDLDPTPWSTKPATMDQYLDLVTEIRKHCARNEEPTSTDESTEESGSPQHRSRLSSVSSRKISLTCQTLPRSPPSVAPNSINDITTRSMLEPKRTSGGRLRSPAPSPIPSPVASPVPSPSRGRFVVSRVCESSLSSTNSSASSSPLTPSSLGSSPTRFFPPSTGVSSRFRVTVVETTSSTSTTNESVVTTTAANYTVGFNYNIQAPEGSMDSDDSDSVFRPNDEKDESRGPIDQTNSKSSINIEIEDTTKTAASPCVDENIQKQPIANETKNHYKETEEDSVVNESLKIKHNEVPVKIEINQTAEATEELNTTAEKDRSTIDVDIQSFNENTINEDVVSDSMSNSVNKETEIVPNDTEVTRINVIPSTECVETKVNASKKSGESLRDEIIASYDLKSKKPEQPPRQATSLERLLGLFQHPSSLFSASSYVEKTESPNPLQDRVNSMIALGDKFQQYLRDGRNPVKGATEDSTSHPMLHRSVSDASRSTIKVDPVKSLSIPQLSSIQSTCVRDIRSRDETPESMDNKRENMEKTSNSNISHVNINVDDNLENNCGKIINEQISRISDDKMLPENVANEENIEDVHTNINIDKSPSSDQRESLVDVADNPSLVSECKTSVSPKLTDIPEYSILETSLVETRVNNDISSKYENFDIDVEDNDNAKIKCDSSSSTADSINDPSCKNSSHCKVTCDIISGEKNVHTLGSTGDVHNFFTTQFNNDNNKHDDNDDGAIISIPEILKDDQNLTITSETLEETKHENENSSNVSEDSNYTAIMSEAVIDLQKLNINEDNTEIVTTNVNSSLPESNNICMKNCFEEATIIDDSTNETFNIESLEVEEMTASDKVHRTDTIEEFLPLEVTASASIQSEQQLTIYSCGLDTSSNNNFSNVDATKDGGCSGIDNKDSRTIDQTEETMTTANEDPSKMESDSSDERDLQQLVDVPDASVLKNEFAITRIAVVSIDDEDYVPVSMEQVSSSLSEDSGYLGKILLDDNRNGDTSLNDLTAISPGNDRIENVALEASITENKFETANTGSNEMSLKIEEHITLVRSSPESNLTSSHPNVEATETRVDTSDLMSSEFSEDLIFKMTDIDGTNISREISNAIVTKIRVCEDGTTSGMMMDCYYETGQSSSGNLFIEKSMNVHRNSQDSGIEETTASISEDNGIEASIQHSENFQESLDSGIDSECSSVCARVDVGTDAQKERARDPGKSDISVATVNKEVAQLTTAPVEIGQILGNKDIVRVGDTSNITRIDDDKNVNINISEAVGTLEERT